MSAPNTLNKLVEEKLAVQADEPPDLHQCCRVSRHSSLREALDDQHGVSERRLGDGVCKDPAPASRSRPQVGKGRYHRAENARSSLRQRRWPRDASFLQTSARPDLCISKNPNETRERITRWRCSHIGTTITAWLSATLTFVRGSIQAPKSAPQALSKRWVYPSPTQSACSCCVSRRSAVCLSR